MKILTLETTCDETAAAIVTDRLEVLGSVVASQDDLHDRFGGVVPEIAARQHLAHIDGVAASALEEAGIRPAGGGKQTVMPVMAWGREAPRNSPKAQPSATTINLRSPRDI